MAASGPASRHSSGCAPSPTVTAPRGGYGAAVIAWSCVFPFRFDTRALPVCRRLLGSDAVNGPHPLARRMPLQQASEELSDGRPTCAPATRIRRLVDSRAHAFRCVGAPNARLMMRRVYVCRPALSPLLQGHGASPRSLPSLPPRPARENLPGSKSRCGTVSDGAGFRNLTRGASRRPHASSRSPMPWCHQERVPPRTPGRTRCSWP